MSKKFNRITQVATYKILGMQRRFFSEIIDSPLDFVVSTFGLRIVPQVSIGNLCQAQSKRLCYKGGNLGENTVQVGTDMHFFPVLSKVQSASERGYAFRQ